MKYNFDQIIDRRGTNAIKYDKMDFFFGRHDLQPLWVADMDFATPDFILEALKQRLSHPILGYTKRPQSFYKSYIDWAKKRYQWSVSNKWLEFSPGVVGALSIAILSLTNEGDKIIIQPPVYHPFFDAITGNKRQLVKNPLLKDKNGIYQMDFNALEKLIDSQTKMIIISNPHNPVGRVWNKTDLEKLGKLAIKYNLIILSDDIHADFIYSPHQYTPIIKLSKEIAQHSIIITSPSKTFNIAGLSTSIAIIPNEDYRKNFQKKMHDMHLFLGNIFGNIAFETAYQKGENWLNEVLKYLKENINFVQDYLNTHIPTIKTAAPEGTFLMWLDFSETGLSHNVIKERLLNEAKLALNDGKSFGDNGDKHFRLNIATPRKNLETALEKLKIFA